MNVKLAKVAVNKSTVNLNNLKMRKVISKTRTKLDPIKVEYDTLNSLNISALKYCEIGPERCAISV